MKRILSFMLAAVMLGSAVPTVFAADTQDYSQGTQVVFEAANNENYTITVPAKLNPGQSGTVTLSGSWPSNKIVSVTAESTVTLTNSILASDQKVLDVTFLGILKAGNDTTAKTYTETISVEGIENALFGVWSGTFNYEVTINDAPKTLEELQNMYQFKYYSSLANAIDDVNNEAIGEKADSEESKAVAGIYIDDNKTYVVLLKDAVESSPLTTTKDFTLNLGGNTLTVNNTKAIEINGGDVVFDGKLSGSTVQLIGGANSRCIQVTSGTLTINNGTYICKPESGTAPCVFFNTGNLTINGANIVGESTTSNMYGVVNSPQCAANISDCQITITSETGSHGVYNRDNAFITLNKCNISATVNGNGVSYGIYNRDSGSVVIDDCDILSIANESKSNGLLNFGSVTASNSSFKALSNYVVENSDYVASSYGINNNSELSLYSCYVYGTHSGLQDYGGSTIVGGTFEGYGHGGIYFCGSGKTYYLRDTIIRECDMPDGFTATVNSNGAGLYIGGSSAQNSISVYMDGCEIFGSKHPLVLRGSNGEQVNSIYMSNSTINLDQKIRIDNDTLLLHLGVGNNFTAENTNRPTSVIETDETYRLQ